MPIVAARREALRRAQQEFQLRSDKLIIARAESGSYVGAGSGAHLQAARNRESMRAARQGLDKGLELFFGDLTGTEKRSKEIAALVTGGAGTAAGTTQAKVQAAEQAKIEAAKNVKTATEELASAEKAQAERNIGLLDDQIDKLEEMRNAHLKIADAIEKAGEKMKVSLGRDPKDRNRLFRAMERAQQGTAKVRDWDILAKNALTAERAQELRRRAIEAMDPALRGRLEGLEDFLGGGKDVVAANRAKAAEEQQRLKKAEQDLQAAREVALRAADKLTDQLANALRSIFEAQEERIANALERMRQDFNDNLRASKPLGE